MSFIKTNMSLFRKVALVLVFAIFIVLYGCNKTVAVTEITVDKSEVNIAIGSEEKVNVTVLPENATDKTVKWISSDPNIAQVTNGVIKGIAVGDTTVKVKAGDKETSVKVTVYEPKVTVTFNTDGGTEVPSQLLSVGDDIIFPDSPTKKGHTFVGWYKEGFTEEFDFLSPVEKDITAYAKWEILKYNVIFELEGEIIDERLVSYGDKLVKPNDPEKTSYEFLGWFNGDNVFDFNKGVEENLELVGKFQRNAATVAFELDGTFEEVDVELGSIVNKPANPEKAGYDFLGWFTGDVKFDFSTIINEDIYLLAKFNRHPDTTFKVECDLQGGNFTYENKTELVDDFLLDYNTAMGNSDTREKIAEYGNWSPIDFPDFFFKPTYREKWIWLPAYLGVVGSSTNKKACADIVTAANLDAYHKISSNHKYALTYEVRAFILDIKYTKNANWMSSDYSDYSLGNGFWATYAAANEKTLTENLNEPFTLPTTVYREGYNFVGWYTNSKFIGQPVTTVNGEAKVYAKWDPIDPVTEITIKNAVSKLEKLATLQLEYEVLPGNAFNKKVEFISSDQSILKVSDTGLITACNAGRATITIRAVVNGVSATITITVSPQDDIAIAYTSEFNGSLYPNDEAQLTITGIGKYKGETFTYKSSDTNVLTVDNTGKVKGIAKGTATVTISLNKTDILTITIAVIDKPTTERIDQLLDLLIKANRPVVDTVNVSLYYDNYSAFQQYYDARYGSVNYFLFDKLKLDSENYIIDPVTATNKHSGIKSSTEFITVHDTANLDGGLTNHGSYWKADHSTSIHFTVGDYGVVQSLDTKYAAHHAGDGTSVQFTWNDSGVKANGTAKPVFGIDAEGFITLNGTKSTVQAPRGNNDQILDDSYFSNLGPSWKIGENDNYYIGTLYLNTSQVARGVISSRGGNLNSTGIEMCVNKNGNIYDTWQRTAKLVGKLLIEHELDITRVAQHNNFSGKNCPQSLIMSNYWDSFMKMVELEYIIQNQYSDAIITMESNNPSVVNNTGLVINAPKTATAVTYKVTVTIGEVSKTITLGSVVPGTASWTQLNGFYSTKK